MALKYYYQHDPTLAPYAFSNVPGFTEHLDSGAQVASINNTYLRKPNLSTTETIGFMREKTWRDNEQPFGPSVDSRHGESERPRSMSINTFGSNYFPGVSIFNVLGENYQPLVSRARQHPEHRAELGRPVAEHGRVPESAGALGGCDLDAGQAHGSLAPATATRN